MSRKIFHFMDENNRGIFADETKGMQIRRKIEDMKKAHTRTRKVLWHGIGDTVWAGE